MAQGFRIRPAKAGDAEQIADAHIRTWQAAYRGHLPADYLDALGSDLPRRTEMWRMHITRDQCPLMVADLDGRIVGFVAFGPSRDQDAGGRVAEVFAIYLAPEHWRKGIGKALHDEALNQLRTTGFEEVTLWVLDTNERTRLWYERQGWSTDGAERREEIGGVRIRELRYRMSL